MSKWIAVGAALALMTGVTVASAQTSTPGAGAAGQDERGGDMQGRAKQGPAQKTQDAPPSTETTAAGPKGAPKAPMMDDKSSIHQSAGDRDSRDFPKTK